MHTNSSTILVTTENKDIRLKYKLSGFRVLGDVRRKTDGARAFAGRVLSARYQSVDVLEQLGLAGAWVSTQQNVDVRPVTFNTTALLQVFIHFSHFLTET